MTTGWKSPVYSVLDRDAQRVVSSLEQFLETAKVSGVYTATTNGSGDVTIPCSFTTVASSAVVSNGTAHARILAVTALSKSGVTVRVYDAAGAAVTATSVTIHYIITGR
jgi:hypothetical protein